MVLLIFVNDDAGNIIDLVVTLAVEKIVPNMELLSMSNPVTFEAVSVKTVEF